MAAQSFEPEENGTIDRIIDLLDKKGELYDVLRVVDPVARRVTERVAEDGVAPPYPCRGFWSGEETCRNCLAAQAFRDNARLDRLEFHRGRIWLASAIPLQTGGKGIVVETLRDMTGTLVAQGGARIDAGELQALLDQVETGSTLDSSTGLLDRRAIDVRLPRELARARSTRYPLSLVLVAVDGYARLKARHGEAFATEAARLVGAALKTSMRSEQDWVARAAEETFLVVMRNTGHAGLRTVAERLRERVAALVAEKDGARESLTASFALHIEMPAQPTEGPILALLERKLLAAVLAGGDRIA
jgi:two-component system, cell cycle response regulator